MDKTRVLVSSTCYDLNQIRKDLEDFIESMGYQPVLSDSPGVSIPPGLNNIEACKWLVRNSDIFVLIIGGRYGTTDEKTGKSITNIEYDTAFETKMPIYTFVDEEVWNKRDTYKKLMEMVEVGDFDIEKVKTALGGKIEDPRVFEFIDNVSKAKRDQWINHFTEAKEIIEKLKVLWSLLFKQLLDTGRKRGGVSPSQDLLPELVLQFLFDKDEPSNTIHVKPVPPFNKDEIIRNLEKIKPSDEDLKLIEDRSANIEMILHERSYSELGLSEEPGDISEFLKKPSEFSKAVESLIAKINSDFNKVKMFINLFIRSKKPNFNVINVGTLPATEIRIFLSASEKVIFLNYKDLIEKEIVIPTLPKIVSDIINLAKNYNKIATLPPFSGSSRMRKSGLTPNKIGTIFSDERVSPVLDFYKQYTIGLSNNEIRIDIKKLAHGFQGPIINNEIFLCPLLENGEEAFLEYTCHADSLPNPSRGKLQVITN